MKTTFTIEQSAVLRSIVPPQYLKSYLEVILKASGKNVKTPQVTVTIENVKAPGSTAQNRAWHSLIGEYWASGCSSYHSYVDMRDLLKLRINGAKEWGYLIDGKQHTVVEYGSIPSGCPKWGVPKSWSDFNKQERKDMIDFTISEMIQAGVNSNKFDEIMKGLEKEKK